MDEDFVFVLEEGSSFTSGFDYEWSIVGAAFSEEYAKFWQKQKRKVRRYQKVPIVKHVVKEVMSDNCMRSL